MSLKLCRLFLVALSGLLAVQLKLALIAHLKLKLGNKVTSAAASDRDKPSEAATAEGFQGYQVRERWLHQQSYIVRVHQLVLVV